jgi:minor extracellular serine protease Vpr
MLRLSSIVVLFCLLTGSLGAAEGVQRQRYAVQLRQAPVAKVVKGRAAIRGAEGQRERSRLAASHDALKSAIQSRGIPITGETFVLSNAVFVMATREEAQQLRTLPNVGGVVEVPKIYRKLERAKSTAQISNAWPLLGGMNNAGDGVKIAIIDTGIDSNHPAFANSPLAMPSGYPRAGDPSDQQFTNKKVIVARSYVRQLASPVTGNPSSDLVIQETRPDDYSARDRHGHGTAMAMIAAGHQVDSPQGQIAGVAPGAWLGNYKVFGSPLIHDGTTADVVLSALEDAFNDGMDIAVLSIGIPAVWGPTDDIECGNAPSVPCDLFAATAGLAAQNGMVVVVAAGNSGNSGGRTPSFATIESPGTHPDVITVGALLNSHEFFRNLEIPGGPGGSTGSGTYQISIGTTPIPTQPITAPLRDVRTTGNDGEACTALPAGSMNGAIAFVSRGTGQCPFAVKAQNAAAAGALAVVFYRTDGSNEVFAPGGMGYSPIPAGLIGHSDGAAILGFLGSRGGEAQASINPTLHSRDRDKGASGGVVAPFSSRGPNIGYPLIKPEVTAVGENIYTATQSYDPNSEMYDPSGFTVVSGTSFSAPLVAGVAALVLDHGEGFPFYDAQQVKSAIVNAAEDLGNFDRNIATGQLEPAYNIAMGGGEVRGYWARDTVVTITPQTLDFGEVTPEDLAAGIELTVSIHNSFSAPLRLTFEREPYSSQADATSPVNWSLPGPTWVEPGQSQDFTFRLSGSVPSQFDLYDGVIVVRESGDPSKGIPDVKIPYLYIAGDTSPCNIIPLRGWGNGITNEEGIGILAVKVTDCRGLPIRGVPITWSVLEGGGQILATLPGDNRTDDYGIVEARYRLGPLVGTQTFTAAYPNANGIRTEFRIQAMGDPVVFEGGIVEGAGFKQGQSVAPGSFVSIFGSNLSPGSKVAGHTPLPIALGEVNVSIDTRDRTVSIPARLVYVSPDQINIQLPWELAGKGSAIIKVNNGDISTQVREVGVTTYSPGLFQYTAEGGERVLAAYVFRDGQRTGVHGPALRARVGDVLELYANGLGPIRGGNPATGVPTPLGIFETDAIPEVTIGGIPAQVHFSGLAPGFVGLYQLNVSVPQGVGAGQQSVVVRIGGVESSAGTLLVE